MNIEKKIEEELIIILQHLIRYNTENPPGITKKIVNYLVDKVFKKELGFQNEIISYKKEDVQLHNLISQIGTGRKKIIFSGHFDVVPVGDLAKWTYPPFSAHIDTDTVYGRGTSDMKSGIVMIIAVLQELMKKPKFLQEYTLVFAGTADEEAGMTGSLELMKKNIMEDAILLVVAEPTNLEIGIAEKGVLWVRLRLIGKASHGSMPEKGINSIECALQLLPQLKNCLEGKVNNILGKSTVNIGKIEGGSVINVVPETTSLYLDFRLIPEEDPHVLLKKIKSLDVKPCVLEVDIINELPAIQSDSKNLFIDHLKKETGTQIVGLSYATDAANLINPEKHISFVIFGPGIPDLAHQANEYVNLKTIFAAAKALTNALKKTYI